MLKVASRASAGWSGGRPGGEQNVSRDAADVVVQQSRSIAAFSLASIPSATRDAVRTEQFEAAVRGDLHPVVHAVMPLDQAAEAHRQMDRGTVFGRIVLQP